MDNKSNKNLKEGELNQQETSAIKNRGLSRLTKTRIIFAAVIILIVVLGTIIGLILYDKNNYSYCTLTLYIEDVNDASNNLRVSSQVLEGRNASSAITTVLTKNGYTNINDTTTCGWYTDSDCTTSAHISEINSNTILYTKYATLDKLTFYDESGAQLTATSSKLTTSMQNRLTATTSYATSGNCSVGMSDSNITGEVVLPKIYNNNGTYYSVTAIADCGFVDESAFTASSTSDVISINITRIILPEGVTVIGEYAFALSALESISLPDSLTDIGEFAFSYCNTLTSIDLSGKTNLTNIGDYAFYFRASGCLSSVDLSGCISLTGIGNYAFYGCIHLTSVNLSGCTSLTSIGNYAFEACYNLIHVDLSGCTALISIGSYAFDSCFNLTYADLSGCFSLMSIGSYAFKNCSALISITLPGSLDSIGSYAFRYCYKLVEVYNLSNLSINIDTSYGYVGYYALDIYTDVTSDSKLTTEDDYIFYVDHDNDVYYLLGYTGDEIDLTLPTNIDGNNYKIYQWAFYGIRVYTSKAITSVVISSGVTSIGTSAFNSSLALTSVTLPSSLTTIEDSAFSDCYKLVEVYDFTNLNIELGSEDNGYVGYYALDIYTDITSESKLTTEGDYIYYIDRVNNIYYLLGYTGNETSLTLPTSINGNNYKIYQWAFASNNDIKRITITSGVTEIGDGSFMASASLISVNFVNCESLTSIGKDAFAFCFYLTSVDLSSCTALTIIDDEAFSFCIELNSITLPSSLTSIGGYAFQYCTSLTTITLPSGLTSIGQGAFSYSSLTTIALPSSLTSIGSNAFYNCTSLTSIWIPSSVITITADSYSDSPFYGCSSSLVIYCEASEEQSGWGTYWNYYASGSTLTPNYGYTYAQYLADIAGNNE